MPREQITHNPIIQSQTPPSVDGLPSATINVEQSRRNVHVAWNPREAGWVQIAVDLTVAEIRSLLEHAEREAAAAARANEDIGEYMTEAHPVKVFSDVLDRAEVNKTIHVLRRARDSAYGKDA